MYLDTGTLLGIMIALGTSLSVIVMSFAEHRRLLNKYNLLKISYNAIRTDCDAYHVRKPF